MKEIVLASHNAGKLRELQALLGHSVKIRSISEFSEVEPEETGLTFIENAILKARNACRISGLPALADDSGLTVDYLNGAPGIYSARYSLTGGDAGNNSKLLDTLQGVPDEQRGGQFICVLALLQHAEDPLPIICEVVGKDVFCMHHKVKTVLATTRYFMSLSINAVALNCPTRSKTKSVTALARCSCSNNNCPYELDCI